MVIDGWLRVRPGTDHGNVDLAAGAGDAFGCTGDASDGLFGSQPGGSGSASDRLAASYTTGDASDAVRFPQPVQDSGGHDSCGADDGYAGFRCRGFIDDSAIDDSASGTLAAHATGSDGTTDRLLATGQCGEPGPATG